MTNLELRSPHETVGGIVHFGRVLDKIRAHAKGQLPPEYQANLGRGFDASCVKFLQINYAELVERVKQGGTDDEILQWCLAVGRKPTENDIFIWNEFMRKRGWNDELSDILNRRKREAGMAGRSEIETMFSFIDADEGRPIVGSEKAVPRQD